MKLTILLWLDSNSYGLIHYYLYGHHITYTPGKMVHHDEIKNYKCEYKYYESSIHIILVIGQERWRGGITPYFGLPFVQVIFDCGVVC
mmetsp:Transcript_51328/g.57355  ORF Transcript_51328/g.57355 Transcript_51328/m.57355 type:complete len:88 (+) Transcript_51328:146-409(+)